MRNAGLDEAQAGIKITGRNIYNLTYADDTTLMAESEELKSLLMKVKSESEVAQLCPTPSDPMDCSLPGSSVHEIFQARVLEWRAITFSDTALYSQQKQDWELTVAQIMNSLLLNSDLN